MLTLVLDFDWGVGKAVALLFLRTRQHIPGIPGRPDSLFLDILVVALWFDRGPLVRGRYSFVGEHSKNSIVLVEGNLVPFGRRIIGSHSRMGGLVCCLG